jgi:hypothetical protein
MNSNTDKTVVVVDTNLFIHFRPLDQIDWSALRSKNIELVVLPTVIRELEKLKAVGQSARIRSRAGQMTAWLSNLSDKGLEVQIKDGLRLRFETNEPTLDFADNNLVREVQDDVLIAGLLTVAQTSPTRPVMATADLGVKMKARVREFNVFAPQDSDKLADEPDPRDKELKELRKENEQLKNRQPRLFATFNDGESRLMVVRQQLGSMPATLADIQRKYPLIGMPGATQALGGPQTLMRSIHTMSNTARDRYNEDLQKFYSAYEKYFNKVTTLRRLATCRLELFFMLENAGSAPATDIDVMIEFPKQTKAFTDERLIQEPTAPEPPELPNPFLYGQSLLPTRPFLPSIAPHLFSRERPDWSITVDRHTAHFKLDRLKQGFQRGLPTIFLQFAGDDELQSSTISVEVSAAEMLGSSTQELHLIVPAGQK